MVQTPVKVRLVLCQISDPGKVDGDYAHRTGALARAEETARFAAQLPQIQPQPAAHTPDVAGFHIAVDIIRKIRRSILGSHLKQKAVILCIGPVKILCNRIGGNGILKSPPVGIPLDHGFNKGPVDHIHLSLTVLIFKVHLPAAYNGIHLRHVVRHRPVKGNVGKWCLRPPAAWRIYPVDKGFNALFHLRIGQPVCLYKGRKICIKGRKGLGACPFVLHNAEEIHHLAAQH